MLAEKKPPVKLYGALIYKTASAILWEVEGTGIWFPLSTVSEQTEDFIVVDYWIADKKGVAP